MCEVVVSEWPLDKYLSLSPIFNLTGLTIYIPSILVYPSFCLSLCIMQWLCHLGTEYFLPLQIYTVETNQQCTIYLATRALIVVAQIDRVERNSISAPKDA